MKVKAGWTIPAAVIAVIAATLGWWIMDAVIEPLDSCTPQFIWDTVVHATGPFDQICDGVPDGYFVGVGLIAFGALLFLSAVIGLILRARRSARQDMPWAPHRAMTGLALRIDRAIPRRGDPDDIDDEDPRLGVGLVALVLLLLLGGLTFGTVTLWQDHQRAVARDHLAAAEKALAALRPPTWLIPSDGKNFCNTYPGQSCFTSTRVPRELQADLAALIHGTPQLEPCSARSSDAAAVCPVAIRGTIHGYPAFATANRQLLFVQPGRPLPPGALPFRHSKRTYLGNTMIQIFLIMDEPS